MPGRFLVFMPTVDHVGVSRKIESREERSRLRGIVREFREAHGFTGGVIIRTAAAGRPKEDIVSDLEAFHAIWTDIRQQDGVVARAGRGVYREQNLVGQAAARSADRRISGDPDRQRAGLPAGARARRAHPAGPGAAGEALREAVPDFRGVRRPGGDRQGAQEQGLAEVRRIDRHQPDRGARRHRREHRALSSARKRADASKTRSSRPTSRP